MRSQQQSPLRCPLCGGELSDVRVRTIGDVTAHLPWQMHTGFCTEHGWFQAEVISKPPREIFAVDRPGGTVRQIDIDGRSIYGFPTVWNSVHDPRTKVDPLDSEQWEIDWDRLQVKAPANRT